MRKRETLKIRTICIVLGALIGLANGGCTGTQKAPDSTANESKDSQAQTKASSEGKLTQAEAELRFSQVQDVSYKLSFDLTQASEFTGTSMIQFTTLRTDRDLRVDFAGGVVKQAKVDGVSVELKSMGDHYLVPRNFLKKGAAQQIAIDFKHGYGNSGKGLSRFEDPVDKAVYLHTQLEAFYANMVFPSFDQPDLKATYELDVIAPKDWTVVTSVREQSVGEFTKTENLWRFPRSAKFSTYIFSLHAGPFAIWEDSSFRIPLRLMARKSMAKQVKVDEWFPITKFGFDFFEKYFATAYPYSKYDQLVVPEFSSGAMENVGAVTFTERFLTANRKTKSQQRSLAEVILHEMAHMWFGNLVTMKWWGDLWLNESFATYMAYRALSEHPDFPETWASFFDEKSWAYYEDRLPTTHPIVGDVKTTDEAFASFDGITYGKGASVLKQLSYVIGDQTFKKALSSYFKKYREGNTRFADFMNEMSKAHGADLSQWQTEWFSTAGLNVLTPVIECRVDQSGKSSIVESFAVQQTVGDNGSDTLRSHSTQVAFFNLGRSNKGSPKSTKEAGLIPQATEKITVSGARTGIEAFNGKQCPDLIALNDGDHGYFISSIDAKSRAFLFESERSGISRIKDPLSRLQAWHSYWDLVRDGQMDVVRFIVHSAQAVATEQDELVLKDIVRTVSRAVATVQSAESLAQLSRTRRALEQLENAVWMRLELTSPKTLAYLDWLDAATSLTTQPVGLAKVAELIKRSKSTSRSIDQDRRWNLVKLLARYGYKGSEQFIASEAKRDPSSRGTEQRIAAEASLPNWDTKTKWLSQYRQKPREFSVSQLRMAYWSIFPAHQKEFENRFAQKFVEELLWASSNLENTEAMLVTQLTPRECEPERPPQLDRLIQSSEFQGLKPAIQKSIKGRADENRRCRAMISKALTAK